jgi:hypothetical protein
MRPSRQRNHLSLAETLLEQPLGNDPEHVEAVRDRVNQEPDAHTLLNMLGISCA